MSYHVTGTVEGMIALPEELRRDLGVRDGGSLIVEREGRHVMVQPGDPAAAPRRLRDGLRGYGVDQFLRKRRGDRGE